VTTDLNKLRLRQAQESLDDVQSLIEGNMDVGLMLTSLYYAYYYSILALMNKGQVPTTMQSVTIGLFEQQYIITGVFKKVYGEAVRRIYSAKPNCSGERTVVSGKEVKELAELAGKFIHDIDIYLDKSRVV
jgi:uncharacterized protein (UPF0332 family)